MRNGRTRLALRRASPSRLARLPGVAVGGASAAVRRRAAFAADRRHVLAIAAHRRPTLASGLARLVGTPLMRGALPVRRSPSLARDLALTLAVHRCEPAIAPARRTPARSLARLRLAHRSLALAATFVV